MGYPLSVIVQIRTGCFDLGYGGNGITFSMIGAQIICKKLQGIDDERGRIFGYERIENIGNLQRVKVNSNSNLLLEGGKFWESCY